MELWETKVETVASLTLPFEETIVVPIGDVQLGAQGCDTERLKRNIDWGMEHNAYFLGMGEYLDILSPSNRQKVRSMALYDTAEDMLEEITSQKVSEFLQIVRGSEGRWLGLLEGHHFFEFRDGATTDTMIAQALKAPFLGTCAFVRLKYKVSQTSSITCTIWCHHGVGSGQKAAAPLNRLENIMPYFDADIYLIGHQHKKVATPIDQIYMTRQYPFKLQYRTKIIACTGGYLLGYLQGSTQGRPFPRGTYVEKGMRPPVSLGCILLFIRPVHNNHTSRIDLNVGL